MNKQELVGLPEASRDITLLKGRFSGKKILTLGAELLEFDQNYKIRDYFDLIITDNLKHLDAVGEPDIIVYDKSTVDVDGVVDLTKLFSLSNTLICINPKAVEQMRRLKLKPRNFMLSLPDLGTNRGLWHLSSFVWDCQVINKDLRHYNSTILQADEWSGGGGVICNKSIDSNLRHSLDKHLKEADKYRCPLNLRIKNRPLLMETWS